MEIGIAIAVGLLAGVLAGMLGIGGGAILVPGMVLLLGVGQHTAQGVSLAVIAVTALVGATVHYRQGNVRLRVALGIAPVAVLFSFIGAMVASKWIDPSSLRQVFGAVVIALGIYMVVGSWRLTRKKEEPCQH